MLGTDVEDLEALVELAPGKALNVGTEPARRGHHAPDQPVIGHDDSRHLFACQYLCRRLALRARNIGAAAARTNHLPDWLVLHVVNESVPIAVWNASFGRV